jgi:hypothetical protein
MYVGPSSQWQELVCLCPRSTELMEELVVGYTRGPEDAAWSSLPSLQSRSCPGTKRTPRCRLPAAPRACGRRRLYRPRGRQGAGRGDGSGGAALERTCKERGKIARSLALDCNVLRDEPWHQRAWCNCNHVGSVEHQIERADGPALRPDGPDGPRLRRAV